VEAAIVEVILDAGAACPRDRSVDDVELAMVSAAELVPAPVERLTAREETVSVGREHVVDDDLRARGSETHEHSARSSVRSRSE